MPTLIHEDGTRPQNANSYCSIEFADNYHELVGNTDWESQPEDVKTAALIKATESIDLLYGPRYLSRRLPDARSLLFPRYSFDDQNGMTHYSDSVPVELQKAVAVHAMAIINGVDPYPQPSEGPRVKRKKSKLGDLEVETEYAKPVETETYAGFNLVELLLAPLLKKKGASNVTLGR